MVQHNLSDNKRIAFWDNVKFFMILSVVIAHFAEFQINGSDICKSIFIFFYAFHMPVLFFVSGVFFKPYNIIRKALFYVCCGYLLKIFLWVVYLITDNKIPEFSLFSDMTIPWFMFVLAIYTVSTYFLRNINMYFLNSSPCL